MQHFLEEMDINSVGTVKGNKMSGLSEERQQREALLQQKVEAYLATLYKVAFMQMKNAEDAEDVVQEVFYQYIRTNTVFESQEHEKAWLLKVTLNTCRKLWRSAWFRHRATLPEDIPLSDETDGEQPESLCIRKEENRGLMQAVWELPDKYREVIHLFYYEGLSVKEIALICGRQESTVTSQLTRGRNMLKKSLKEEYQFEEFQRGI